MRWIVYCLIYLGTLLMAYNIYGFVRFARRIGRLKNWGSRSRILYIPIVLLVLFLLGYLAVGLFGSPDLLVAGILFGGSLFVFAMYKLISGIADRILENEQIEAKLLAAEEANRAKTAFLASMSHEMRTPMNVILGLDRLALQEPDLPPRTRQQLEKIGQSGRHLLGLIVNILEMNDLGAGELALRSEPFCPAEMLGQVNAIAQTLCEEKGLAFRYQETAPLPAHCAGDEIQIKKLLLGLLDNAVKYTDAPGAVSFTVSAAPEEGCARLRFAVADTGVGMSAAFLEHVFEPFTQEDASSTNRFGGGGMSLAVSRKLAELMGGSLTVESEKGRGSTFVLELPLPVPEPPAGETPELSAQEAPEAAPSLAGRRVLVVEDVPENAEIVQDLLELEDVASDHAENGLLALERFAAAPPGTYDAIIMDLRMPVMDGLEATRRIRALPRADAASIPIIALTANAFQSDVDASLAAGMNAHLAKPADAELLYGTLSACIFKIREQKGVGCHDSVKADPET